MAKFRMESEPGRTTVVRLHGELDIAACEPFEQELARVRNDGARTLVVDLSGLEFIDSSGLRSLLKNDADLRDAGLQLVIVRGPPPVQRVFQITRTDDRLAFVDNVDEVSHDHSKRIAPPNP
jgi:anti-anti-sigma factor